MEPPAGLPHSRAAAPVATGIGRNRSRGGAGVDVVRQDARDQSPKRPIIEEERQTAAASVPDEACNC